MQIFSTITNLTEKYSNIVVALGTFDGIHIGHQSIIRRAIELAQSIDGKSAVFTFSNHPLGMICPSKCPKLLADNDYKTELIEALGVDLLFNVPFTPDFLRLSPTEFLKLLKDHYAPRYIVVGPNYSFGYQGRGNAEFLVRMGEKYGFVPEVHTVVHAGSRIVSSTRIRTLLEKGKVSSASELLGKNFKLRSSVVYGDQRGRTLGFPTANIDLEAEWAVPGNGVYAVRARVDGQTYKAIANVGTNPTFDGLYRHIEVHIFDFSASIYGQILEIEFFDKIRDERKFEGPEALVRQINADISATNAFFDLH